MSDDEDARTLWCGNLSDKVTHDILYELFYQAGPLDRVRIPRDYEGRQRSFGFVTYTHRESVSYAMDVFRGTTLFDRVLKMQAQKRSDCLSNGNTAPTADVAKLLGRPVFNGTQQTETELTQSFIAMTNSIIIGGVPPVSDPFTDSLFNLGVYDHQQNSHPLSAASLQGHWTARHNPERDRASRRHEPYKDRNRRNPRERENKDGGRLAWSDRERDRNEKREEYRNNERKVEMRVERDDRSRGGREDFRGRHQHNNGNNQHRGHRNHSRD